MSEDTQQAVVTQPDAQATPAAEGADARASGDDLESLLKEFDTSTQPKTEPTPTPAQQPGAAPISQDALKRLETLEKTLADDRFQKAIAPVIQTVRGDIPKDVMTDEEIQDWMEGRAKRDPRLTQAWIDRDKNPQAWGKVQAGLRTELSKKFSKLPDANATEDRDAVTAAVRGASTKAPEGKAPDFSKASNQDFRNEVEQKWGYTPNV